LRGLWVSDDDFCTKVGIDGILLYIGEETESLFQVTHKAYLIIHADGSVLVERRINISYYKHIVCISNYEPTINIQLEDDTSLLRKNDPINMDDIMPNQMNIELNMNSGCMHWSNDDTVYAKLYKDPKASLSV
jgi:hypothetical protein